MFAVLQSFLGDSTKLRQFCLLDPPLIACEYEGLAAEVPAEEILRKLPCKDGEQVKICKQLGSGKWSNFYHTGLDELQASRRAVPFFQSREDLQEHSAYASFSAGTLLMGRPTLCQSCQAKLPTSAVLNKGRRILQCQPDCDIARSNKRRKTMDGFAV